VFAEFIAALRGQFGHLPPAEPKRKNSHPSVGVQATNGDAREPVAEVEPDPVWPPARIVLAQRLWGEGFVEVGGAELVKQLAVSLNPTPNVSLLDMSAGLGGAARALNEMFGVYVTGLEAHPELARIGAEMSKRKGMAKVASVEHYDPMTFAPARLYNGILVREGLFHQPHLGEVFTRAVKALKPGGTLVLVDYVRVPSENPNTRYLAWIDAERQMVHPWTTQQYGAACKELNLEVHAFEDMTDAYRKTVLQGWAAMLADLHLTDLGEGEATALVEEAEMWMHRVMAFEHNALRVMRLHAKVPQKT
jgi:cyclopropane fatty-acyl-phospholipid synthase-like methyltransferase